jgi:hypothetical protein
MMNVYDAQLRIYHIGAPERIDSTSVRRPAEINQLAQARFAEMLSTEEKRFITENFPSDRAQTSRTSHLGRFLDVKA